jgi:Flp pilus assembly protein TadB
MELNIILTFLCIILLILLAYFWARHTSKQDSKLEQIHQDFERYQKELAAKHERIDASFELWAKQRENDIKYWETYAKQREEVTNLISLKAKRLSAQIKNLEQEVSQEKHQSHIRDLELSDLRKLVNELKWAQQK